MTDLIINQTETDSAIINNPIVEEDEVDESMEELRVEDEEDDNTNCNFQFKPDEIISQNANKSIEIEQNNVDDDQKVPEIQFTANSLTNELNIEIETQEVAIEDHVRCDAEEKIESNNLDTESTTNFKKKKRFTIVDSDSEDEDEKLQNSKNTETTKVADDIPYGSNKPHLTLSDEEDAEKSNILEKMKIPTKLSALIDSDSSSDASEDENNAEQFEETNEAQFIGEPHHEPNKNKKPKEMRASARKALDEMQAIQSEQQRLHREAHISVPYHKPKKHTLQDFLKRRTIFKPENGIGESTTTAPLKGKRLKMTTEELEQYAKLLEERAKEAQEFFKSENEEELETTRTVEPEKEVVASHPESADGDLLPKNDHDEIDNSVNKSTEMPTNADADAEACTSTAAEPSKPKVIITEVVELPRLDMSTINITPPKPPKPISRSERLKQLLAENNVIESPSLRGNANMVIDLETGDVTTKKPTAVDGLLQRCLATNKARKSKGIETVNILSTENGKLEMSKVNIHVDHDADGANKPHKPGEAYFKLKENLKTIITRKRLEDMKKKQEEENEHRKCLDEEEDYEYDKNKLKDLNGDGDDDDDNDEDDEKKVDEENIEVPKFDVLIIDDEENALNLIDDTDSEDDEELQCENNEVSDDDDDDDDDHDNEENDLNVEKPKSRILQIFADESDEEEPDLFSRPKPVEPLYQYEQSQNASQIENELIDLCSGRFETTQKPATQLISQIPITQKQSEGTQTEELLELCSGTFDGVEINENDVKNVEDNFNTQKSIRKILSTDEEDEANDEGQTVLPRNERNKKLTKKIKRNKAKLGFSDDEDEDEENVDENKEKNKQDYNNSNENINQEGDEKELPGTYVDYDSEENEIIVEMTKDDRIMRANKFVEKEAELSESDWGSADEDERNMDKYDIELGDEDEFDGDQLRHELGQIHARKMLDEDIKEVRKIQEMFFEDEETDGVGRQRQFKWKNAENGFSLNDSNRVENEADACGSDDEENEQMWRKIRYEREQLLQQQNIKSVETLSISKSTSIRNSTVGAGITIKKVNIITSTKASTVNSRNNSPFLILKSASKVQQQQKSRESFLNRDKDTLKKLAGLTKSNNGIAGTDDSAGTVSIKSAKTSKNFVFATLTEEEHENNKRKADDLLNSSSEHGINYMKKPRIEPRQQKCLIDQLL